MIRVTRLNGTTLVVNALLIETMESTPDTVLSLTNGNKIVVRENVQDVINLVKAYLQEIGIFGATLKSYGMEDTQS